MGRRVVGLVRPWPGEPERAHLVVREVRGLLLDITVVRTWLAEVAGLGYHRVRTNALPLSAAEVLHGEGFRDAQRLVMLAHRTRGAAPSAPIGQVRLRTVRVLGGRALGPVSSLDRKAFGEGWWLDEDGIVDALRATPSARLRTCSRDGHLVGYAVTGRAGRQGFLQRLAVDPACRREGMGTLLVADSMAWLHRHGVGDILLNTHEGNDAALAMYRQAGFEQVGDGLVVLDCDLDGAPS